MASFRSGNTWAKGTIIYGRRYRRSKPFSRSRAGRCWGPGRNSLFRPTSGVLRFNVTSVNCLHIVCFDRRPGEIACFDRRPGSYDSAWSTFEEYKSSYTSSCGENDHEVVFGEVSKADFWCNRHCQTSPVDLGGFQGLLCPRHSQQLNDLRPLSKESSRCSAGPYWFLTRARP